MELRKENTFSTSLPYSIQLKKIYNINIYDMISPKHIWAESVHLFPPELWVRVVTAEIIHLQRRILPPHVNILTLGNVESDLQQEGEIDVDKTRLRSTKIHGLHYTCQGERTGCYCNGALSVNGPLEHSGNVPCFVFFLFSVFMESDVKCNIFRIEWRMLAPRIKSTKLEFKLNIPCEVTEVTADLF